MPKLQVVKVRVCFALLLKVTSSQSQSMLCFATRMCCIGISMPKLQVVKVRVCFALLLEYVA